MPAATTRTPAAHLRIRLQLLEQERAMAALEGLGDDPAYMADLREELEGTRAAYVGSALTEIASLRAAMTGPLHG
ncbi:MAG TPA: hypothetical protein VD931_01795 [Baekduia sp.]|nr:hypothetical protein [Baekduia sp.]